MVKHKVYRFCLSDTATPNHPLIQLELEIRRDKRRLTLELLKMFCVYPTIIK